jgi:hypothetical protein
MCVFIILLKDLVFIELKKHVIFCIKFIFIIEKTLKKTQMKKLLIKIKFNKMYNNKKLYV